MSGFPCGLEFINQIEREEQLPSMSAALSQRREDLLQGHPRVGVGRCQIQASNEESRVGAQRQGPNPLAEAPKAPPVMNRINGS